MIGSLGYYSSKLLSAAVPYTANAVELDGTNDYLTATASGLSNDAQGILSVWVKYDTDAGFARIFDFNSLHACYRNSDNSLYFLLTTNEVSKFVYLRTAISTLVAASGWLNILCSWNCATGSFHVYLSDVESADAASYINTTAAGVVTWADANANTNRLFADVGAGHKMDGCASEYYLNTAEYLDFSVLANRRKFIDDAGKPVDLGTDGSTPTGTSPTFYHNGDSTNFQTNKGTGYSYSVTGALAACASSPSD